MLAAMQWAAAHPKLKVIVQSGEGAFFTTGLPTPTWSFLV
jgi:hypothetical protein